MIALNTLLSYTNDLLQINRIKDYAPNGLQVAGKNEIKKIISGVTACQALLDAAVAENADLILVHHGYFWKNEDPCITGIKYKRLKTLLTHDINLLAYHLPLDVHSIYGNNVQLGKLLNIQLTHREVTADNLELVCMGELAMPQNALEFANTLKTTLNRDAFCITGSSKFIKTIAWCTGSAEDFIETAIANQVDAYLTGEVSERTVHMAREAGIHFFAAGHHATERYGVAALGEHLAQQFQLTHQFVDIDNPI